MSDPKTYILDDLCCLTPYLSSPGQASLYPSPCWDANYAAHSEINPNYFFRLLGYRKVPQSE
jgi:hypothetical protein